MRAKLITNGNHWSLVDPVTNEAIPNVEGVYAQCIVGEPVRLAIETIMPRQIEVEGEVKKIGVCPYCGHEKDLEETPKPQPADPETPQAIFYEQNPPGCCSTCKGNHISLDFGQRIHPSCFVRIICRDCQHEVSGNNYNEALMKWGPQ